MGFPIAAVGEAIVADHDVLYSWPFHPVRIRGEQDCRQGAAGEVAIRDGDIRMGHDTARTVPEEVGFVDLELWNCGKIGHQRAFRNIARTTVDGNDGASALQYSMNDLRLRE